MDERNGQRVGASRVCEVTRGGEPFLCPPGVCFLGVFPSPSVQGASLHPKAGGRLCLPEAALLWQILKVCRDPGAGGGGVAGGGWLLCYREHKETNSPIN